MADFMENFEIVEQAEQNMSPEQLNRLEEMYTENVQEAERGGNEDMAKYYREKLEKLKEQALASDDSRMGGWYAGYTPAEWRRMASEEYAKNGNSMKYRQYIENAQKAEG